VKNEQVKEDVQASDDFVSSSKIESSDTESKNESMLDDGKASDFQNSQTEEEEEDDEQKSEEDAEEDEEAEEEEEEEQE